MTPIDYRIGYRVKVNKADCITHRDLATNINWGTIFEDIVWAKNSRSNYFKGTIVDIKTHKLFGLIKLDDPIYTVELELPKRNGSLYVRTKHPKVIVSANDLMAIHYIFLLNDEFKKEPNNVANSG